MTDFEQLSSNLPRSLEELFILHDEEFLRVAYHVILGREIDRSGMESFLRRIRRGDSKLEILASLRYSAEGRRVNAQLPGLRKALRVHRFAHFLRADWIFRKIGLTRSIDKRQRRLNVLENELGRLGHSPVDAAVPRNLDRLPSRLIAGNVATAARVWNERPTISRILIFKLDHFGDFFVAIRAFTILRDAWPDAHITLVCGSWNVRFAIDLGIFDEILPFDFSLMTPNRPYHGKSDWVGRCEPIGELPLLSYDLAIDLRHDMDTRPCLLFTDAKYKAGYNDPWLAWPEGGRSPLNIGLNQTMLHAELRCTVLAQLVVTTLKPPQTHPISRLLATAPTWLPFKAKRYVIVSMRAGAQNREWGSENFVRLLQRIGAKYDLSLVFVGAEADRPTVEAVAAQLPESSYVDLSGTPFEDLPFIMGNAAAFIGCDSGPGHLSALLGVPTLSLYAGVSEPQIWQPLGPRVALLHSQTPCSYCHDTSCNFDFRCMREIRVDDAFDRFSKLYVASLDQSLEAEDTIELS
jgi:ADP-heptose:LPS heptosyltransferase